MYINRNKIRVICSKIRVGMEGVPFSIGGGVHIPYSPIEYGPQVHIRGGGPNCDFEGETLPISF